MNNSNTERPTPAWRAAEAPGRRDVSETRERLVLKALRITLRNRRVAAKKTISSHLMARQLFHCGYTRTHETGPVRSTDGGSQAACTTTERAHQVIDGLMSYKTGRVGRNGSAGGVDVRRPPARFMRFLLSGARLGPRVALRAQRTGNPTPQSQFDARTYTAPHVPRTPHMSVDYTTHKRSS